MTPEDDRSTGTRVASALAAPDSSARLRVALAVGTSPDPDFIDALVDRCAVEPDFYVRDMLTWALIRHDQTAVTERLLRELSSPTAQARSQALHTLSKIADPRTWPAITTALLRDEDDEVARAAWRTAAGLVPDDARPWLSKMLATQLGRGERDLQLSLSRAFVVLGPAAAVAIERASSDRDPRVRAHAIATERLIENPDEGFDAAVDDAKRIVALLGAPGVEQ